MQSLIEQMTAALAQLDAQREALTAAIAALQGTSGPPPNPKAPRATKARPATRHGRRGRTEAASEKGETTRPTRAPLDARQGGVLAALKSGPLSLPAIAEATHVDKETLRYTLKKLVQAGLVTSTGQTTSTRYRLTT